MDFHKIKYYTAKKILNVNFEKEIPNNLIEKIIEFKKIGKIYYIDFEEKIYKLEIDKNTEIYIDNLLEKNIVYLGILEDINTIISSEGIIVIIIMVNRMIYFIFYKLV